MHIRAAVRWKTFLTLSTWIQVFSSVSLCVIIPTCLLVNRLSHTVHKYGLGLSSCGYSVISLLSAWHKILHTATRELCGWNCVSCWNQLHSTGMTRTHSYIYISFSEQPTCSATEYMACANDLCEFIRTRQNGVMTAVHQMAIRFSAWCIRSTSLSPDGLRFTVGQCWQQCRDSDCSVSIQSQWNALLFAE